MTVDTGVFRCRGRPTVPWEIINANVRRPRNPPGVGVSTQCRLLHFKTLQSLVVRVDSRAFRQLNHSSFSLKFCNALLKTESSETNEKSEACSDSKRCDSGRMQLSVSH